MRTQNPIINTGTPWKPLSGWNIIFVTLWLERWANIQVHHLMMLLYKYSCWVQWNCTKNEQNYIRKPDLCAVIEIRIHRNNELNWKTNFYPQNWYQNKNYDPSGFLNRNSGISRKLKYLLWLHHGNMRTYVKLKNIIILCSFCMR